MTPIIFTMFAATPEEVLYGYGPLGVGVVALSFFGLKMFNIILKDRDKAIADRDAMVRDLFEKVLPAIARNTDVLAARQELDRTLIDAVKQSGSQLEANKRVIDEVAFLLAHGNNRTGGG